MPIHELNPRERSALRATAHALDPVVLIGDGGLTPAVLAEIDRSLNAHGLIKIKVAGDDRNVRGDILRQICADLNAASVQHIGKILVIYRQKPDKPKPKAKPRRKPERALKRTFQHRP